MAEKINSKRVLFPRKKQKKFLDTVINKISIEEMAKICDVSQRTIRDWRREKFLMDFSALRKICKKANISLPRGIKLKDKYWYIVKGCSIGGKAVWRKYGKIGGDLEHRKKKWREWWEKEGKYKCIITIPKKFKKPALSENLAEFIGIVLGDGCITKNQITITLHSKDDKEYGKFVVTLIEKLFDVPVGIYYCKGDLAVNFSISRSELVKFCCEELGLKKGNKIRQQVDIPVWVKKNKKFSIACVRGLFDTDGCVFNHHYKVNGKYYNYKKISFTSHSIPLLQSAFKILVGIGIKARVTKSGKDIRIDGQSDVKKYFELIGSNNPKYLKKYQN